MKREFFLINLSIIFTIFCFLILINSLNFYDGINGQSCLIFIYCFTYLLFRSDFNLFLYNLYHINFNSYVSKFKNMFFLGDSGIYLLSIILSISLIYEHNINKNIDYADEIFSTFITWFGSFKINDYQILNKKNPLKEIENIHHLFINKFSLTLSNIFLFFMSILPLFFIYIFRFKLSLYF